MKSMKKLIPALCLLLISAVLMGTSTYAWFSMNTVVTATGMNVTAIAEKGIAIALNEYTPSTSTSAAAYGDAGAYGAIADAALDTTALYPTSTTPGNTAWYHSISHEEDKHNAAIPYTTLSLTDDGKMFDEDGNAAQYYVHQQFSIKVTASEVATFPLYLTSVDIEEGNDVEEALNNSLRIMVKWEDADGNTGIYFIAPYHAASDRLDYANGNDSDSKPVATAWAATDPIKYGKTDLNIDLGTVSTDPTVVDVYVYYDGEDDDCKSTNAIDIDSLSVSLNFTNIAPTT